MRSLTTTFVRVGALLLAMCKIAEASVETGDIIKLGDGPGGNGGIFWVTEPADGTTVSFPTFCVQLTEHIGFNTPYKVVLNDKTKAGDVPLGSQAAWLYTQFLHQTSLLSGFDFSLIQNPIATALQTQAQNQANAVQLGIWLDMGFDKYEIRDNAGWSLSYQDQLKGNYLNAWLVNFHNSDWDETGNTGYIKIMNLYEQNTHRQDQLIEVTPEPATMLIWAGLGGIAFVAHRRRCASPSRDC
jgi:hypothetical protein